MTIIRNYRMACAVCGTENNVSCVESFTAFGSNLDGRPRSLGCDPVRLSVQHCKGCGYCSSNIGRDTDVTLDDLSTAEYQEALESDNWDWCHAILTSKSGDHNGAGHLYLHAAWRFDDGSCSYRPSTTDGGTSGSKELRELGLAEFGKSDKNTIKDMLTMVDMLRCVGRLEEAKELAERLLSITKCEASLYRRTIDICRYQIRLIDEGCTDIGIDYEKVEEAMEREGTKLPPIHDITLDTRFFNSLERGNRRYDVRFNNCPWDKAKVGDVIRFKDRGSRREIFVDITEVHRFQNLEELYASMGHKLANPDHPNPQIGDMDKYRSEMGMWFSEKQLEMLGVSLFGYTKREPIEW
ncbi:MAG: hypothetical protein IKD00_06370 [Candidatus Methanomethylophilaceae archaeon]|nr:hypothetical protein [Candidatus Methanomethylophilaceae archaeon]